MALLNKLGQVLTTDLSKDLRLNKKSIVVEKSFVERIKQCQPIEQLGSKVHLSQNYLSALIIEAIKNAPLSNKISSLRFIIVYHQAQQNFWQLVEDHQRQHIPSHIFAATQQRVEACKTAFASILFFEDQAVLSYLNKRMPLEAEQHPIWSAQHLGSATMAAWGALSDIGLGANLLHYRDFDYAMQRHLNVESSWQLKSQLVFGSIEQDPMHKPVSVLEQHYQVLT